MQKLLFDGLQGVLMKVIYQLSAVVEFTWQNTVQNEFNLYTDKATFVVYNVVKHIAVIKVDEALRKNLTYVCELPGDFAGDELHGYMSFINTNGKVTGDSAYCGSIVV